MLTPQFTLGLATELVVDLFAGGGGASTGIEQAIGRYVDIAVNHDREAVAMHLANHPQTKHYLSNVFDVSPRAVTKGQPVGLLWASPDCTFHSKARGGKPFRCRSAARQRRGLAGVVIKWAKDVRPRVIALENVEEFLNWGPLLPNGVPCPDRAGKSFERWVAQLRNLGYKVEWKQLRACDYGSPTIRRRLFLIARCDGAPIVWPAPTHAEPSKAKALGLKPYLTAADCIDWSIPCPSIFERDRELAEATQRRIAKGIMRYVINDPAPFLVPTGYGERAGQGARTHSTAKPMPTLVGSGKHALVQPSLIGIDNAGARSANWRATEPLRTTTTENRHALVSAFLTKFRTGSTGSTMGTPVPTVTANGSNHKRPGGAAPIGVVQAAFVAQHNNHGGGEPNVGRSAKKPVSTITTAPQQGLVTTNLVKLRGTSSTARTNEPLHTISAEGTHHAEVRAFLIKYFGTDQDPRLAEPLHTVTTKDRFGLVTIKGTLYQIADIGLRMLQPRELFLAQGFPADYVIDWGIDPVTGDIISLTKTAQVRMCGNSVCPQLSRAIVAANYADAELERVAA